MMASATAPAGKPPLRSSRRHSEAHLDSGAIGDLLGAGELRSASRSPCRGHGVAEGRGIPAPMSMSQQRHYDIDTPGPGFGRRGALSGRDSSPLRECLQGSAPHSQRSAHSSPERRLDAGPTPSTRKPNYYAIGSAKPTSSSLAAPPGHSARVTAEAPRSSASTVAAPPGRSPSMFLEASEQIDNRSRAACAFAGGEELRALGMGRRAGLRTRDSTQARQLLQPGRSCGSSCTSSLRETDATTRNMPSTTASRTAVRDATPLRSANQQPRGSAATPVRCCPVDETSTSCKRRTRSSEAQHLLSEPWAAGLANEEHRRGQGRGLRDIEERLHALSKAHGAAGMPSQATDSSGCVAVGYTSDNVSGRRSPVDGKSPRKLIGRLSLSPAASYRAAGFYGFPKARNVSPDRDRVPLLPAAAGGSPSGAASSRSPRNSLTPTAASHSPASGRHGCGLNGTGSGRRRFVDARSRSCSLEPPARVSVAAESVEGAGFVTVSGRKACGYAVGSQLLDSTAVAGAIGSARAPEPEKHAAAAVEAWSPSKELSRVLSSPLSSKALFTGSPRHGQAQPINQEISGLKAPETTAGNASTWKFVAPDLDNFALSQRSQRPCGELLTSEGHGGLVPSAQKRHFSPTSSKIFDQGLAPEVDVHALPVRKLSQESFAKSGGWLRWKEGATVQKRGPSPAARPSSRAKSRSLTPTPCERAAGLPSASSNSYEPLMPAAGKRGSSGVPPHVIDAFRFTNWYAQPLPKKGEEDTFAPRRPSPAARPPKESARPPEAAELKRLWTKEASCGPPAAAHPPQGAALEKALQAAYPPKQAELAFTPVGLPRPAG